jgi:hypothetical protein
MGMVDEKLATQITKEMELKRQYDEKKITLAEYVAGLQALGTELGLLPDRKLITIEMATQTTGSAGRMSGEAGDIVTNNNSTMNVNVTSPVGNGYTPARAGQDAGTAAANRMRARGFPE